MMTSCLTSRPRWSCDGEATSPSPSTRACRRGQAPAQSFTRSRCLPWSQDAGPKSVLSRASGPSWLSRDNATVWTWPEDRLSVLGALAPASRCPRGQPAVPFVQKLLRATFQVTRIM